MFRGKRQYQFSVGFAFFGILLSTACSPQAIELNEEDYVFQLPPGFESPIIPSDNPMSYSKVELGRRLFYDPILSRDFTISCGTCHLPEKSFTDGLIVSKGIEERTVIRNSPTLLNIAYHPAFLRDATLPTLEQQILVPIQEHSEFDFNLDSIVRRLNEIASYKDLFEKSFATPATRFSVVRAIAAFERTLISGYSRYDRFRRGDKSALTASEERGQQLFFEKLNCGSCHNNFDLTDYSNRSNGLYKIYADPGRYRITKISSDSGVFKVPSLRNIALTAPYMHDGSIPNLDQVISHYEKGGAGSKNQDALIQPFTLSVEERSDLIAFLKSLTDQSLITDRRVYP